MRMLESGVSTRDYTGIGGFHGVNPPLSGDSSASVINDEVNPRDRQRRHRFEDISESDDYMENI